MSDGHSKASAKMKRKHEKEEKKHQAKLKPHAADDFKFVASGKTLVRVVGNACRRGCGRRS